MSAKKYQLIGEPVDYNGHRVRRVCALLSGSWGPSGTLGGWLESEANLSHEGHCWVGGEAHVVKEATVRDDAVVTDRALIDNQATVRGDARVEDDCWVCNDAVVEDYVRLSGSVHIGNSVRLAGGVHLSGKGGLFDNRADPPILGPAPGTNFTPAPDPAPGNTHRQED